MEPLVFLGLAGWKTKIGLVEAPSKPALRARLEGLSKLGGVDEGKETANGTGLWTL